MEVKELSFDRKTYDQWQSIGLVEGLASDVDIAKFLIHMYDNDREKGQTTQLCRLCQLSIPLVCETCYIKSATRQETSQSSSQTTEDQRQQKSSRLSRRESGRSALRNDASASVQSDAHQSESGFVSVSGTEPVAKKRRVSLPVSSELVKCKEESVVSSEPWKVFMNGDEQDDTSSLTLVLKQENHDEEGEELPHADRESCSENLKASLEMSETTTPASSNEVVPVPKEKKGGSERKKVWGEGERKVLAWFLDKYQVQRSTDWEDCALVLKAVLGTATTGEDCRQQALKRKLLTPKSARKTRTSAKVSASKLEPRRCRDSRETSRPGRKLREGRAPRKSIRPGLRSSSSRSVLMDAVPDPNDLVPVTFTEQLSPSNCDRDTKEDGDLQEAVAALSVRFPETTVEHSGKACVSDDEGHEAMPMLQDNADLSEDWDSTKADVKDSDLAREESVADTSLSPAKSSVSKLTWHYLGVQDVDLPDVTRKRKSFKHSPNDRYKCKECSSFFTHRGILVKHIRLAHLKWRPHHCNFCSAAYATKTKLQRHINVAHTKVRPFCCETCGASFVDHYTLICHKDTHEKDRQYRFFCELCGKGYYGMRELKRHMETHSSRPTKSLLCWVCGKAVRTTQYLRIHLRTHSPDKAFTCSQCGHVFTSKCALEKHKTTLACRKRLDRKKGHSGGKEEEVNKKRSASLIRKRHERKQGNFQCDICQKYFSAKKNIYKHKRSVHGIEAKREADNRIVVTDPQEIARYLTPRTRDTSSLKFACDICSKRYSSQESMRKHKNIVHFGRRDYKCDLCDKTFTRHTSVIEHKQNVHNPEGKTRRQTAHCDICQKDFAAKNSLRKHLKTVHFGLLPYSCAQCGKKFASKYHLREHHKTSGHAAECQKESVSQSIKDPSAFLHAASSSVPMNQSAEKLPSVPSVPSSLASACLPSLDTIGPWPSAIPSSEALTLVHRIPLTSMPSQEMAVESDTTVRGLQSVSLWNLG